MTFGGNQDNWQGGYDFDIWDPAKGTGPEAHIRLPNGINFDSFCAAVILQASNSKVMVAGGNANERVSQFNAAAPQAGLTPIASMKYPRYYASLVTLPDGRLLVHGGSPSYGNQTNASEITEIYNPGQGWYELPGTSNSPMRRGDQATTGNPFWYPHVYPMANNEVFVIAGKYTYRLNYAGGGSVYDVKPFNGTNYGATSSGLLYRPGLAMQIGGGSHGNNTGDGHLGSDVATIFDLRTPNVTTRDTKMAFKRHWPTAVVLANGEVLVVGGSEGNNELQGVANTAEIYNPDTDKWRTDSTMQVARLYHSTAIMMKDGRVLLAGGGAPGPVVGRNAEIYTPDYLLNAAGQPTTRPSILSGPTKVALGRPFQITTDKPIRRVTLVKTGAVTHGYNTDQRFFDAVFQVAGNGYSITFPNDPVNATPGLYMVFAFDEKGVPSVGKYVRLPSPIGDDGSDIPNDVPTSPLPTGTAAVVAAADGWQRCAAEGQICQFEGIKTVRFGANGRYASRIMANGAWCDIPTLGNPGIAGVRTCDVQTTGGAAPAPAPAPTPTPAPTPEPTPTSTGTAGWTACATEGQLCKFDGIKTVRFGANGTYASRVMANAAWCDIPTLGNPGIAGPRTCDVQTNGTVAVAPAPAPTPTPTPASAPTPTAGWTACAREGQLCKFDGVKTVRFGANGKYASRVMANAAWCDAATLGNPAVAAPRSCDVQASSMPAPAPTQAWAACASEGQLCTFQGIKTVRYGANGTYATRQMGNSARCDNATFGDPLPGVAKQCQVAN